MKNKLINITSLFLVIFFSIIYLELLFKIRVLYLTFDENLWRVILFSLSYSSILLFLIMFFKRKTAKILSYIVISIVTFLYLNQEIYNSFVEGFYSFTVVGDFRLGLSFFSDYVLALRFGHLLYLFPITSLILLRKFDVFKFKVYYFNVKQPLILLMLSGLLMFISLQTINQNIELKNSDETESISDIAKTLQLISYSDRDLYTYMYNSSEALKKFGLLTYTQRDFFTLFRSDFLTQDAYEILLDDYYENKFDHNNNTYTDIFEDKNLILIMAESLDTFAINEVLTPNLWYLKENYGYFENFYAPLYYRSTADSEFLVQTSMYPDKNVTLSMKAYLNNEFPNTLPKLFQEQGYNTYSFHNYTDYFYPRSQFHINTLGYDQYWGSEELELSSNFEEDSIIFNHTWESDFEMMELAVEKFINDDAFFVNMLTVSGHFPYNDNHEMAKEEYLTRVNNYFENLEDPVEVDESIKYYLAVTMEFDKAIGYLMDRLDETNRLKDTVIMIFGDHYAYGLDSKDIWNYTNKYKPNNDMMNIHKVPFLLINEDPILKGTNSNYMSTIDILPTVSNLFGLDANMKFFYGNDALSSRRNIVRFADGSFLSKDFKYNALSEEYTVFNNSVTKQYISEINRNFMNDYMYNLLTLKYDYYDNE